MANNVGEKVAAAYESSRQAREERALDPSKEDQAHMIAAQDAARLQAIGATSGSGNGDQRLHNMPFVNYTGITQKEAGIINEEERKALGRTPPVDSLAAEALAFAGAHWRRDSEAAMARGTTPTAQLKEATRMDAARIATEREARSPVPSRAWTLRP